jgi:DivIVA domain-containing protein
MPLTPADVANVVFGKPALGKRGYHEGEVDTFLDLVQAELRRLIHHRDELRGQVERLEQRLTTVPGDPAGDREPAQLCAAELATVSAQQATAPAPDGEVNVRAAKVLALAQQMIDKVTCEAHADAEEMLCQARISCQQLLAEAKTQAEEMVTQASTRAETLLTEAQSRAETRDKHSRDNAAALERQAARQHAEVLGALRQEKSILEKKIDQLRTFDQDYRTRLTTYLQALLRQLDQSGSATPPEPIPQLLVPVPAGSGAQAAAASAH